jgi:hypothetical protein
MTKWYSPKDKLPPIGTEVVGYYFNDIYTKYLPRFIVLFSAHQWGRTHVGGYDDFTIPTEQPDLWCYLPEVPRELIDKLKEE